MATIKKAPGTTLSGPTIYGKKKVTPTSSKPSEQYATSKPIKSRTDVDAKGNFVNTGKYETILPKKTSSAPKMKCGGKQKKGKK